MLTCSPIPHLETNAKQKAKYQNCTKTLRRMLDLVLRLTLIKKAAYQLSTSRNAQMSISALTDWFYPMPSYRPNKITRLSLSMMIKHVVVLKGLPLYLADRTIRLDPYWRRLQESH